MSPYLRHPFIMTFHAIYSLTCLGEHQLVDSRLAYFALETMRVIRVVSGHDSFI